MIPDGTPPEAIIVAVVVVVFVACVMMAALFWFTLPRKEGPSLRGDVSSLWTSWTSRPPAQPGADERADRTDDADGLVSEADQWLDRIELERTRAAVMELLVYSGWTITDMRREGMFRGENATISAEVEAMKKKLGITGDPRQLRVRDDQGERLIPMDA